MNDNNRTVQMHLVEPGKTASNGDFEFSMQPRYNAARTVTFALPPADAEQLLKKLSEYIASLT